MTHTRHEIDRKTTMCWVAFLFALFLPVGLVSAQSAITTASSTPVAQVTTADQHPYRTERLTDDGRVQGDFVVGPGKIEVSLAPGTTRTAELLVTNRTGEAKVFSVEFEDMTGGVTADQALVLLGNDRGPYTLRDYLSVPQRTFKLDHMERARVPVTITMPSDAEPGGRYGSVLFSIVSREAGADSDSDTQPASAIVSRIGTLFFVTAEGDIEREGELVDFATKNNQHWFSRGPVPFQIVYENTGSQHLNPYGFISIKNIFGEEVGFIEVDPWFVLPQAIRARDITFPRTFMFGYYTAELQLNRGYDDVVDTKKVSFMVVPWRVVLLLFAGLVVVFLVVRLLLSRFEIKRK